HYPSGGYWILSMTSASARQVVLVVEDDAIQRLAATFMLEDAGFEAIEAVDTDDAIRILESRSDIRLIFTDIDMPGSRGGMTLTADVRDRWPPIEIIMTSGQVLEKDVRLPARSVFFAKPYLPQNVIATMRQMLA